MFSRTTCGGRGVTERCRQKARGGDRPGAELRLADGLGGKAYFIVTSSLDLVEAAVSAAQRILDPGLLVTTEIIAAPHDDLLEAVRRSRTTDA